MRRVLMAMMAVAAMTAGTVGTAAQRANNWTLLGERVVTDKADHDTIVVTVARGGFTAMRFDVLRHAVDFHRVVIHFGNGDDQKVELRHTIPAGGSSRVIDVQGGDRVIKSIDFWYDAK